MTTEVIMPQLGESVVEGTVTKWLIGEADSVEEFEPLVEINTDKVDTEVPSPATGTILKLLVAEGETVKAGTLLAVIGEPGEVVRDIPKALPENGDSGAPQETNVKEQAAVPGGLKPAPGSPGTLKASREKLGFISPVVARIAAEHDVDLGQVSGTGSGGRITKKDVLAYVESGQPVAPWEEPASGELFRPTEEIFGEKQPAPETATAAGTIQPLDAVRAQIAGAHGSLETHEPARDDAHGSRYGKSDSPSESP